MRRPHSLSPWVLIPGRAKREIRTLTCRSDLPATRSGGQPPPASSAPFLEPRWPSQTLDFSTRITPLLPPTPRTLQLKLEPLGPAARGSSGTHNHPLPSWGPSGKARPWAAADLSLPCRPRALPGLGAREGAAGAGPDYLQEESFGFGSPLLGPIQLTLPLPAAEKHQRLKRAPSRAPLRAVLPSSPVSPRGAPAKPRPRCPCQLPKLTSARRLQ